MINSAVFAPSSIVVVGASEDPSKVGGRILKNIKDSSFSGPLYGINPKAESVQGVPCPSLEELPETELAILAVQAGHIPGYMKTLAQQKRTKGFIVLSAGFSEMGSEGEALQREITEIADTHGASLIGPNCTGVLTQSYAGVFAGPIPPLSPQGCDLVSGSGATAAFILEQGITAGLTFSQVISVGNSAQIGAEDVLAHWDETFDPETSSRVKLLYLEHIADPLRLLKHSSSLIDKGCRICAVKSGSSQAGSRAASSHTGAMASNDSFVDALFRKAGIIRCRGRKELVLAGALCRFPAMRHPSMAVVTHAGGPGVMLTDMLSEAGIQVPKLAGCEMDDLLGRLHHGSSAANPIDFLATGTAPQLDDILTTLSNSRSDIGGISVIFGSPGLSDVTDVLDVLADHIAAAEVPIYPILPSIITAEREISGFTRRGLPFFSDEVEFARVLGIFRTAEESLYRSLPPSAPGNAAALRRQLQPNPQGYLPADQVAMLFDAVEINRTQEQLIEHAADLPYVAIPFPWAMKVVGPVHKSDVEGVRLNITSHEEAHHIARQLMNIPGAEGMLIQEMAEGMEFYCGVSRDPAFGHLLMAGLGGVFVETLRDTSSRLLPIDRDTARSMLTSLRSYSILTGARGKAPLDTEGCIDIMLKIQELVMMLPEITEMDLNPVLVSEEEAVSVDARIRIA